MGLEDRDYMRDRYRARKGLTRTIWNDKKGRVEHLSEPMRLGSAGWIDRLVASDKPWSESNNRGFGYGKGEQHFERRPAPRRSNLAGFLPFGLSLLLIAIPLMCVAERSGWLPDSEKSEPFPETGSVTVAANVRHRDVTSFLTIETSAANAVVQLFEPDTDRHVLSIYVAGNERIRVPVPKGTFRMKLIEGQKWHGAKRFFGPNTSFETVAELMTLTSRSGHIVDLHRRPDGNLKTRPMLSRPEQL